MPRVRDVLGHVSVEVAAKRRKCHRSAGKHGIQAGDCCLVVREGLGRRNYCRECSAPILAFATTRLTELQHALNPVGHRAEAHGR